MISTFYLKTLISANHPSLRLQFNSTSKVINRSLFSKFPGTYAAVYSTLNITTHNNRLYSKEIDYATLSE